VRFVGDARTRIREDYLRILRLFRFHAWYGKGELDAAALAASIAEKAGLKLLSGERVQKNCCDCSKRADPAATLRVMHRAGILAQILPQESNLVRLQALLAIESGQWALKPTEKLRLACAFAR
jgi:poly(A) polymerase